MRKIQFALLGIILLVITGSSLKSDSLYRAVVARDGSGDYKTIQEAINAAPEYSKIPWLIFVKNGSYKEHLFVPKTKTFIHLIGQDKDKTIIHHRLNVGGKPDVASKDTEYWRHSVHNPESDVHQFDGSVVKIEASDFYSENISYVNDWGVDSQKGPQALAMSSQADRVAFYNCNFRSFQDTWMTATNDKARHYVKDCRIEGAVDYFYGGGDVLAEGCTFYNTRSGAIIVAPCHKEAKWGYVFRNCTIDGNEAAANVKKWGVKLGRPWHNSPKTVYIHTTLNIPIAPEGWTNMGAIPALFAEYDSRDAQGNLLNLDKRKTEYEGRGENAPKGTSRAVISAEEAAAYTYENIIPGTDQWDPRRMMEKLSVPKAVKKENRTLSWKGVDDAIGYIVFNGDEVLGMTCKTSFELPEYPVTSLRICAVNRYGSLGSKVVLEDGMKGNEHVYADLPFSMPEVEQSSFPDYQVSICDFGAKSDGMTLNTEAINHAIKAVHTKGGGRVVIPEGLWLTGPLVLLSNVNLHAEKNALIVFSGDTSLYPIVTTSFEGLNTKRCQSPISAMNAENIAITGDGVFDGAGDRWRPVKKDKMTERQWKNLVNSGGKVDANGKVWYPDEGALKASALMVNWGNERKEIDGKEWEEMKSWLRPVMVSIVKSKKVLLEGVTFKNSPSWCVHPLSCESLIVNDVKVFNPWYSQNGDALDVESCRNVLITNCFFDAGDDAICLKSGKDEDGRKRGEPCENVIVKNNTVLHGHGGFVIGSEMSGDVRNVYVSGCSFIGTDVGLRFKSTRGRGGVIENIYIDKIHMIDIPNDALVADLYYAIKTSPGDPVPPVSEETPVFRNIHISNVYCRGAGRAVFFNGLPEMPIQNISIKNMVVTDAKEGIVLNKVSKINLENVEIGTLGATMQIENTTDLTIDGKDYGTISGKVLL